MNDNDHDLLIQIATKLDRALVDIKELKDNTTARVTALEEEKVNKTDFDVAAKKIDSLERLVYIGLGIVLTLNVALIAYVTYFHK
jgi:hypothetical protein